MVARRREGVRDAREDPAAVVEDGGRVPVDRVVPHDRGAGREAERLVAEADAEDRRRGRLPRRAVPRTGGRQRLRRRRGRAIPRPDR